MTATPTQGATPPRPTPRGEEAAWFDAARDHRLVYQWCSSCDHRANYPRVLCPRCGSADVALRDSSGEGAVLSWTTQYRAGAPELAGSVPYTLVLAELDEGFRLLADLPGAEPESVRVGERVHVWFDDVDDELTLPRLRRGAAS